MFSASTNNQTEAQLLKAELLEYIKNLDRGVGVTDEQKDTVDSMCKKLELVTPTAKPLSSPLLSGSSILLYTTQGSIIGAGRPAFLRPYGPIYQILGELQVTYLDENLRISRSGSGTDYLYILETKDRILSAGVPTQRGTERNEIVTKLCRVVCLGEI